LGGLLARRQQRALDVGMRAAGMVLTLSVLMRLHGYFKRASGKAQLLLRNNSLGNT